MDEIYIGARVRRLVTTDCPDVFEVNKPVWGTVVYIHPQRRYYEVEFHGGKFFSDQTKTTFRESYFFKTNKNHEVGGGNAVH